MVGMVSKYMIHFIKFLYYIANRGARESKTSLERRLIGIIMATLRLLANVEYFEGAVIDNAITLVLY